MKKNVGIIIPGLKNGGAERVVSTISLNLDKSVKQYIFAWNGKDKDYNFDAEIIDLNIHNSTNILKNISVLVKRVIAMKKYKKKYNLQTCISHLEGANIVNILSKGKEKTVITVHNFQSKEREGIYGLIFRVLIRVLYNRADKIVVVSKLIKEDLINNFGIKADKVEVIYNPFDCKLIEALSKEELEDSHKEIFKFPTVINVGRLTEQKGQWHLINAFKEIKKNNSDVKLVILGQGELEGELNKLIEKYDLKEEVFLLGYTKNPFKYIAKAKVFALTSLYEGFPMCIAEAMACGTPVISVDCKSGPREMLTSASNIKEEANDIQFAEYGVLTPSFTKEDDNKVKEKLFAKAIDELLHKNKEITNYSFTAKEKVKDLDVSEIIKKWNKLI